MQQVTPPHKDKSSYIRFIRLYTNLYSRGYKKIAKILYWLNRFVFTCDIPCTVRFGQNLCLPHFGLGVVMHPNTIIGDNVKVYQNVTLGARNGQWATTIGNNVTIGCGACVLGKLTIGNYVNIGANAVVLKDLPDNSTAVGIPAKIVIKKV